MCTQKDEGASTRYEKGKMRKEKKFRINRNRRWYHGTMLRSSRIIEKGKEMRWKKDGMVGTSGRGQRCTVRVRIGSEGRSSVGLYRSWAMMRCVQCMM